ncbi:MAG: HAMP domain-containing histidine kinase [Lachnospiraceae bacterium]|nr:HAMP domain-containing histidine kinase [Lachnospiraceae bacterium]
MELLLAALSALCIYLSFICVRSRKELHSLCRQLEEVSEGSHIELTVNSRRKPVLELCRMLNRVLRIRDALHLRYERDERQLKQNITSLAHDIRTPLTGAFGYVQLAEECRDAGKQAHYLAAVKRRLSELEDMLEEMFLYTKLTGEDFILSPERLQVLPLLGECLLSLYTKFQEAGTSPNVSFESEDFYVMAHKEALQRVFLNLIQNALVHGEGGITVRQTGKQLQFENLLPGNDTPNTEQIFDRFYKSDPARGKGSSGLGLYIVRELMRKMGGEADAALYGRCLRITLYFS